MTGAWHLAKWVRETAPSPLQQMLTVSSRPDLLSLALGLPDSRLFPAGELAEATARALSSSDALQYRDPSSMQLKQHIRNLMASRGVECEPAEIFLTSGAQQALSLIACLLLDDNMPVIVEELSYPNFRKAIEPYHPNVIRVRSTPNDGIDLDMLEHRLKTTPGAALIYTMADGHNPLGVSISHSKRKALAGLASRYRVPILEDDAYGFLQYASTPSSCIRSFGSDYIVYVGSFSKILAPALRIGWIVAPPQVISQLAIVKEAADINTVALSQRVVSQLLETFSLEQHILYLRSEYLKKRDLMDRALTTYFPTDCRWRVPEAGVFFWVDLPEQLRAMNLLDSAISRGVTFMPGAAFSQGTYDRGLRLCFSRCSREELDVAVARLGSVLKEYASQPASLHFAAPSN